MSVYLILLTLLLGDDPQTAAQLFNQGLAAEDHRKNKVALACFTQAIGAVTEPQDLTYAVMSMRHLETIYTRLLKTSPWPKITKKNAKAIIEQKSLEPPERLDEAAVNDICREDPYIQALMSANFLIREATRHPDLADQYLLLVLFLKVDYPVTYLALSRNAKRKGNYYLARRYLNAYAEALHGPERLPAIEAETKELLALLPATESSEPEQADVDVKALKKRLKREKTPVNYYEYAMALANDPRADGLMVRLLWKGHALEPTYVPILLALAKRTPDQGRDHELLPDLLAAYEENPQHADLLTEAIRLAGKKNKAELTRRLLTAHPDREEGYRHLELLNPDVAETLLQEIPWLAQSAGIRFRVFTYLDKREDPRAALDLYRKLDGKVPTEKDILEWLIRCSADIPSPERAQWEEAYRALMLREVKQLLASVNGVPKTTV